MNNMLLRSLIREVDENVIRIKSLPITLSKAAADVQERMNMHRAFETFFIDIITDFKNDIERPQEDPGISATTRECVGSLYNIGNWDKGFWKVTISQSYTWAEPVLEWVVHIALKKDEFVKSVNTLDTRGYPREIHLTSESGEDRPTKFLALQLTDSVLSEIHTLFDEIKKPHA